MRKKDEELVSARKVEMEVWDFGMFPAGGAKIPVPKDLWHEYIDARAKYEELHQEIAKIGGINLTFPL